MARDRKPRALVTGGAGFVDSHLCERLLAEGYRVVCMDNLVTGSLDNVAHLAGEAGFEYVDHDVTAYVHVPGELDEIYHFASPASPADFERIPIPIVKVGALGTYNALGLALARGARFMLASTSEVYRDPLAHPQHEDYWGNVNPIGIRGVYDEAKRYAESITMAYQRHHRLDTRIVRSFNTHGPRMRPDDGRMVPNFIRQALAGEPLTVYGEGSQTRSAQYVDDLVEGVVRLMRSGETRPVNIGNPAEYSGARGGRDGDRALRRERARLRPPAAGRRPQTALPRHHTRQGILGLGAADLGPRGLGEDPQLVRRASSPARGFARGAGASEVRVLLTGGAGLIGSYVATLLLERGDEVAVVDDLSTGKRENIPEGAQLHEVDVRSGHDVAEIFGRFRPEVLCHQAAQMDVRRSVREPDFDAEVNVLGTVRLLQNCTERGVEKVVFASTGGAVYGEQQVFPAPEDHPLYPVSPYGVSKLACERYLHYFNVQFGLPYVALRYANVYGPRQDPHGEAGVVAIFSGNLAADKLYHQRLGEADARLRLRRGRGQGQRPRHRERGPQRSVQHRHGCRDRGERALRAAAQDLRQRPAAEPRTRQARRAAAQLHRPLQSREASGLAVQGEPCRWFGRDATIFRRTVRTEG